jgi:hypothetical protein
MYSFCNKRILDTVFFVITFKQVDDPQVIAFLLSSEVIPLCLRNMEMGSVISKTVFMYLTHYSFTFHIFICFCHCNLKCK